MLQFAEQQVKLRLLAAILSLCATLFLIIGAGGMIWFMYFDIYPPVHSNAVYTMDAMGNRTDKFHAGDIMLVYRDLCFNRDVAVTFGRTLRRINPTPLNIAINTSSALMRKGCVKEPNTIVLPRESPIGIYEFSNVMRWSNNPFHDGAIELPTPEIEIVK